MNNFGNMMKQFPFVSKEQHNSLEQRLGSVEGTIKTQGQLIRMLKERLDTLEYSEQQNQMFGNMNQMQMQQQMMQTNMPMQQMGNMGNMGMMGGSEYRDHSRTPRGKQPLPMCPRGLQDVEDFIMENMLDDRCSRALRMQPTQVKQFVIGKGPATDGTNPSAMVIGRIQKCAKNFSIANNMGDLLAKVEEFISACMLDDKVAQSLREMDADGQMYVLSMGPAEGNNTSAMVQSRIAKYQKGTI